MKKLLVILFLLIAEVAYGAAATTTPNIGLTLPPPPPGDNWGVTLNNNFVIIDSKFPGGGVTPGAGDALVSNPLSQFAATTSAQLAGVITNETGTGSLVFSAAPIFTNGIRVNQTVNNTPVIIMYRATDSAPTGALLDLKNAAGTTSLYTVDVNGIVTTGTWSGTPLAKARQHAATVYTDAGNTWTVGAQNFSTSTSLQVPQGSGLTTSLPGQIGYDTIATQWHVYVNATDRILPYRSTTTPTSGNCAQWSANGLLGEAALPCGSGGGGGSLPGGSNTQVQYRIDAATFGGISGATSDGTNLTFGSANLRTTRPRVTTSIDDAIGTQLINFDGAGGLSLGTGFKISFLLTALTTDRVLTIQNASGNIPYYSGTPTNGNCAQWTVASGIYTLTDAGAACGTGGGGGGSGDITDVIAGTGMSGGATSGSATLNWAPQTQVGNLSFWDGTQSTRTLTFDIAGTDPVLTIGTSSVDLTTGTLKQGGVPVVLQSRNISTTTPLSGGGGTLASDLTLSCPTCVSATSAFATDNRLLRSDSTARLAQASLIGLSDNGELSWTAGANNLSLVLIKRNTDTSPTGKYLDLQKADGTTLFSVSAVDGSMSIGNTGAAGTLELSGNTSGTVSLKVAAIAGTYDYILPITAGTVGQVLTSQGGSAAMTWTTVAGTGTVTSVAQSFTGGLISVAGTPITTSGTLALTVAGTSGGIPYFSSASTWASSAALTLNLPVIGGGAGAAPTVGTVQGNTTKFVTYAGSAPATDDCAKFDSSGNLTTSGAGCGGGGGGSGIVSTGAAGKLAAYPSTGTTVDDVATADSVAGPLYCADAGSTDTYACSLSPAPTAYTTGTAYRFKANTLNTGAASINFNSLGAKTIKKVAGGVTTDLATNDIRAGQIVEVVYDGTNMQMQSTLGNTPASAGAVSATCAHNIPLATDESTTGTSYADLSTVGATCSLTTGTTVLVSISSEVYFSTSFNELAYVAVAVSGATTVTAADGNAMVIKNESGETKQQTLSRTFVITGLTAGSNTFTLKFKTLNGNETHFRNRDIVVWAN